MATPVSVQVYLYIDGAYTEVTKDVWQTDTITVTRGSADEASDAQPSSVTLLFNNGLSKVNTSITGRYSPRNPLSDLYGKLTRNTPCKVVVDSSTRIVGEIASLPPTWDTSMRAAWVPVQVSGVLRRLSQGTAPITSGARAYIASLTPYAYWPLDDAAGSINGVNLASGGGQFIPNRGAGSTVVADFGAGTLGQYLPKGLLVSDSNTAQLTAYAYPPFSVGHTDVALDFIYQSTGTLGTLSMQVSDKVESAWQFNFRDDGVNNDIQLFKYTGLGSLAGPTITTLGDTAPLAAVTDTNLHYCRWQQTQSGADTVWTLYIDGVSVASGTAAGVHMNGANQFGMVYQVAGAVTPVALGHVTLWVDTIPSVTTIYDALILAFSGETAGARISRICTQQGITFTSLGTLANTVVMGPQPVTDALSVMKECAATDGGTLTEPRASLGLLYITRDYSYNRTPDVTLDFSLKQLVPAFEPVDDDQSTRNDVTVTNTAGSSYEATKTSGPLGTQSPTLQTGGVGPYTDSASVNVANDADLRDQAGWRVRLGTVNESRYPTISVHRQRTEIKSNPTLDAAVLALDLEQRLVIANATAAYIYDNISQLVRGTSETITPFEHVLTFNCSPESPYQTGVYDAANSDEGGNRYSSDGTTVQAALTSGATTLPATTPSGPNWAHNDGDYDLRVAGERMTVTAVDAQLPTFVASSASVTGNNASLSPTLPAGTVSGDTVFIYATIRSTSGRITTPTNWTNVGGGAANMALLARVYDGAWSMPTVAFTGGSAGDDTLAQAASFKYVDIVNRGGSAVVANGSQQNVDYGTTTPGYDNTLLIKMLWKQDDWTSVATPASHTLIGTATSTAGNDAGQAWYYVIQSSRLTLQSGSLVVTGGASAIGQRTNSWFPCRQNLTVTRSVNGVVKAQTAGTTVDLFEPAYYAL